MEPKAGLVAKENEIYLVRVEVSTTVTVKYVVFRDVARVGLVRTDTASC
jgi:hypothetical protein